MFVGHGLLAFALLAAVGRVADWPRERTLQLAVLAAVFATLPDVDILYAPVGLLGARGGVFAATSAFWQTGNVVHRALTHSLVLAPVVALAAGLWVTRATDARFARAGRALGAGLVVCLVVGATLVSGGLAGVVVAVFGIGALAIATVARRRGIGPTAVAGVALVALASHPFGDLFTGEPPAMLYPLDVALVTERILLHPDPTLHLLAAFFLELLAIWLAVLAYHDLRERRLRDSLARRATVGLGYAAVALALPAPTLDSSYQFVFTALAVSVVGPIRLTVDQSAPSGTVPDDGTTGTWSGLHVRTRLGLSDGTTAIVTGLTAVTLAGVAYTLVYLLL